MISITYGTPVSPLPMLRSVSRALASSAAEPFAKYTRAGNATAVRAAGGGLASPCIVAAAAAGAAATAGSGRGLTAAPGRQAQRAVDDHDAVRLQSAR